METEKTENTKKMAFKKNFMDNMPDFEQIEADRLRQEETPDPTFTEAELNNAKEIARQEGHAEGHAAGLAAAQAERETELLMLCNNFATQLTTLLEAETQRTANFEKQSIEIGLTLSKRLFPNLAAEGILTEIESLISNRLSDLHKESHLILHTNATLAAPLKTRLAAHPLISTLLEKILFSEDANLDNHSCKLEWPSGSISYNISDFWQDIDVITTNILENTSPAEITAEFWPPQNEEPEAIETKEITNPEESTETTEIIDPTEGIPS